MLLQEMTTCASSGVSGLFSSLSLISWICAQLPQIMSNYRKKSAEGISPLFLLLWFMGDFLSFTSCLLNDAALNFQIYLSLFFLANDLTLCYQYYHYNSLYPRVYFPNHYPVNQSEYTSTTHSTEIHDPEAAVHSRPFAIHPIKNPSHSLKSPSSEIIAQKSLPTPSSSISSDEIDSPHFPGFGSTGTLPKLGKLALVAGVFLNTGLAKGLPTESETILEAPLFKEIFGLILAWSCTFVYVSSRCPQLYKNYLRKSVDGISSLLFGSALLGNLAYSLSVLTSCDFVSSDDRLELFWKQLPYLLGSSGIIVFDIAYFYQRHIYRGSGQNSNEMDLEDWRGE